MNRLRLASSFLVPAALASAVFACGGISDPTRSGETNVATISGALTGVAVPAGARVAVVWSTASGDGYAVSNEAAIKDGKFSLTLAAPPDSYLRDLEASSSDIAYPDPNVSLPDEANDTADAPTATPAPAPNASNVSPRTAVSGGIVTGPLRAAVAGFVVYVDANGNGKLDLTGTHAGSPDTIIGGNRELVLAFLKGGGKLDYEKLRDGSGVLPAEGFNLNWAGKRWVGLNLVELKIEANAKLPGEVCGGTDTQLPSGGGSGGAVSDDEANMAEPAVGSSTPPRQIKCAPDGRSYTEYFIPDCARSSVPPPPPPPSGLCTFDGDDVLVGCEERPSEATALAEGEPVPAGWPCPPPPPPPSVDAGVQP